MRLFVSMFLTFALTACLSVKMDSPTPPLFVTSTLPALPTVFSTPTGFPSPTTPPAMARPANCTNEAVLIQDVTIPDGAQLTQGESFIKTWRLRNTGTCPWDESYRLVFAKGERMKSPDFVALPPTAPNSDVDISVPLTAPSANGIFTAFFELHDSQGNAIRIGLEQFVWVIIAIGAPFPTAIDGTSSVPVSCAFSLNDGYVYELLSLLNGARQSSGLPAFTFNAQLTAAAQGHSQDMACNNFLSHFGSDGLYANQRIIRSGYPLGGFMEIIAIGSPQDAMNQWRADSGHWEIVLTPGEWDVGIDYAYFSQSDYGGYFTVDIASP